MRKETMRGQLFNEKISRIKLEGEIKALQFSIKYKELSRKMEDAERSIDSMQTRMNH
ncbi:hypothetical protein QRE62_10370 [Bacillus mycoides]|uniref:hypothetical protein n=1 Tax=Bacillus mycoides TaxID=1405 RepID=UPI0025713263|nr:hypothetical protein [Bacillus mycoides]WJE77996.1 hypothetical protein QRE62_10370 [Bacillus mycoides]